MKTKGSIESFTYKILDKPILPVCGEHIEHLGGITEESRIKKKFANRIKKLTQETYFTTNEIEALLLIYFKFANCNKKKVMTKAQMKTIMHNALDMTDPDFNDIVLEAWERSPYKLSFESWVKGLSLSLRGKMDEQARFCFRCYDKFGYGKLSRDAVTELLGNRTLIGESDDALRDFVEMLLKRLDIDRDGMLSIDDYVENCMKEPMWIQCFRQCLPTRSCVTAFLSGFTKYSGRHY